MCCLPLTSNLLSTIRAWRPALQKPFQHSMSWETETGKSSTRIDQDYNELIKHASDAQYQEMAAAILGIAFAVVGITSMIFCCINEKRIVLRPRIGRSSRGDSGDSVGSVTRKYFFLVLGK